MKLKTKEEINLMREAGLLLWHAHEIAALQVGVGVMTAEIDAVVEDFILSHDAIPLFKGVPGVVPFPATTCMSVNSEVVHGIPSSRKLKNGDIVSIDMGLKLNGWCADSAVTYPVGEIDPETARLIDVTEGVLRYAIGHLKSKTWWSEIAKEMQKKAEIEGFSVVRELVGHGIGKEMWEPPHVPNFYTSAMPDFCLLPGLVFAIEPMVNTGTKDVIMLDDHWTIATKDGEPSAHFEHTVAITDEGPLVLTSGPNGEGWAM